MPQAAHINIRLAGFIALLGACLLACNSVFALEFRSVSANATVLYDAPSLKAKRLYVASQYYPVEVVVSLEDWNKVRDSHGDLAWVEKKQLSDKRTVLVTVPLANIRQTPELKGQLVFQAEQNVALELIEFASPGWVKVRHRDGQSGFVSISQVWGI